MTLPITPDEVGPAKARGIPPQVIEAANELIARNWNGASSRFTLVELAKLARTKLGDPLHRFHEGDLDIEISFSLAGWSVVFDKPGYCESYDAFFVFARRR